ncbi:hypothetical protein E2C01_091146 [Portunus trituberculatus]|uniref:Uncharacterized protein n=1 Tax=Portunus trituberculatus TaxID=210409 RepID=A0A5B7JS84_PORTR|nr:hypothetical protein [Portunus trituberculatus]
MTQVVTCRCLVTSWNPALPIGPETRRGCLLAKSRHLWFGSTVHRHWNVALRHTCRKSRKCLAVAAVRLIQCGIQLHVDRIGSGGAAVCLASR